jgi:hypothetical protein
MNGIMNELEALKKDVQFDLDDIEKSKVEYKKYLDKLCGLSEDVDMGQVEFQKLLGLMEVLGELIIKSGK